MLETELPAPMANTTMIFVCIFLIFWFLKAFRRLARTVLLRRSLIFGNVVQIQGLASYLSFFEEATRAHLNSIVQTRQSKPAVPMSIVYVSCLFEAIQLFPTANPDIVVLSIKMKATMPGKLYLLTNFDPTAFKKVVHDTCLFQNTTINKLGFRDVGVIFRESIFASDRAATQGLITLPFLSAQEVCLNEGYAHDIDSTGQFAINVAIKSPFPSNSDDKSVYNISLCFVPDPVLRDTYLKSLFNPNKDAYDNSAGELVDLFEPDDKVHAKMYDSKEGTQGLLSSSSSSSALSPSAAGENTPQLHRIRRKRTHSSTETMASPGLLKSVYRSVKDSVVNNVFNQRPAVNSIATNTETIDIEAAVNPTNTTANSTTASSPAPLRQFSAHEFSNNAAVAVAMSFSLPRHLPSVFPPPENMPTNAKSNSATAGPAKRMKKDLYPKEVLVVDRNGQVYNSLEVFGLGAVSHNEESSSTSASPSLSGGNSPMIGSNGAVAAPLPLSSPMPHTPHHILAPETLLGHPNRVTPAESVSSHSRPLQLNDITMGELNRVVQSSERDNPGHPATATSHRASADDNKATSADASSLALAQGGAYLSEECVVCLTDPKEILLLPCRHLCVCAACFVFVDKCPVCRALFDQYVAIQGGTKVKFHSRK